jgi:hypothetical protein
MINMLSSDFIRRQADIEKVNREIPKEKGVTVICSIGRFSNAKILIILH